MPFLNMGLLSKGGQEMPIGSLAGTRGLLSQGGMNPFARGNAWNPATNSPVGAGWGRMPMNIGRFGGQGMEPSYAWGGVSQGMAPSYGFRTLGGMPQAQDMASGNAWNPITGNTIGGWRPTLQDQIQQLPMGQQVLQDQQPPMGQRLPQTSQFAGTTTSPAISPLPPQQSQRQFAPFIQQYMDRVNQMAGRGGMYQGLARTV